METANTNLPPGFDGTPQGDASRNTFYEFCGLKLTRYAIPNGGTVRLIGTRTFGNGEPRRIYCITVEPAGTGRNDAAVFENDKPLIAIEGHGINRAALESVAVSALHRILNDRCRRNGTRRGKNKA